MSCLFKTYFKSAKLKRIGCLRLFTPPLLIERNRQRILFEFFSELNNCFKLLKSWNLSVHQDN